jgi:hypothetical protein
MNEYEAVITIRIQGESIDDVPSLVLEAMGDHDNWPVIVRSLDGDEPEQEIWMDKNTGLRVDGPDL